MTKKPEKKSGLFTLMGRALGEWMQRRGWIVAQNSIGLIPGGTSSGLQWDRTTSDVIDRYYGLNVWLHAAVSSIAKAVAQLPIRFYRETVGTDGAPDREEISGGAAQELVDLFWSPNLEQSRYAFIENTVAMMKLEGEFFWFVDNGTNGKSITARPQYLHLIPRKYITAVQRQSLGVVDGFQFQEEGGTRFYQREFFVHEKNVNPFDTLRGLPLTEIAALPVQIKNYLDRHNRALVKNGARLSGYLQSDQDIDDATATAISQRWDARHGSLERRGGTPVLGRGAQYQETGITPKDGDFAATDERHMQEILALYGVPPVVVGQSKEVNYANAREQLKIYYQYTVIPTSQVLADGINWLIRTWYDSSQTIYAEFDSGVVEALQEDQERKARVSQIYVQSGIKTINEVRADLNLPPVDWGDQPRDPFGSLLGGSLSIPGPRRSRLIDDPSRDAQWRGYAAKLKTWERATARNVRDFFGDQSARIIAAIKKLERAQRIGVGDLDAIFDPEGENAELIRKMRPLFESIIAQAGQLSLDNLNFDDVFKVADPAVGELIRSKVLKVTRINATTREDLRALLADAADQQLTIDQTARTIRDLFDGFSLDRATTIARTETIGAANGATLEGFKQADVTQKQWLSSRDADVRDSHAEIDGEVAPVGLPFANGLMFPGGDGPPEEVINCRCTMLGVIE